MTTINDCQVIEFPKIVDPPRGDLTFIEGGRHIPFEIKRIFYIYDLGTGVSRGAHAHKKLHEILICLSGGFDVELDDGAQYKRVRLNRPWLGLHIPPMIWASQTDFDPGTVCLVLTSEYYDDADYIRIYEEFRNAKLGNRQH
jgi:dTDP-4-dehydrorhamnose 3,5-epimerase-like enzyme